MNKYQVRIDGNPIPALIGVTVVTILLAMGYLALLAGTAIAAPAATTSPSQAELVQMFGGPAAPDPLDR